MLAHPSTSMSMLERAREGDDDAWGRIVHIYGPIVFEQCCRRGLNDEDAHDTTQEVFVAISQGLSSFRRDRPGDSFLHWIRKIASHKIIDSIRKSSKSPQAMGASVAQVTFQAR